MSTAEILEYLPQFESLNRVSRKTIEALFKCGARPVTDIKSCRLFSEESPKESFCVKNPIVFSMPSKVPSYAVIGDLVFDRENCLFRMQLIDKLRTMMTQKYQNTVNQQQQQAVTTDENKEKQTFADDEVEMLMNKTGKTKDEVISKLKELNGDVVETLIALQS